MCKHITVTNEILFVNVFSTIGYQKNRLREAFRKYTWNGLLNSIACKTIDVSTTFGDFNAIVKWHVEK